MAKHKTARRGLWQRLLCWYDFCDPYTCACTLKNRQARHG